MSDLYSWLPDSARRSRAAAPQIAEEAEENSASMAKEKAERAEQYRKQDQLRAFIKERKKADDDFTADDRKQAEEDFEEQEAEAEAKGTVVTVDFLKKAQIEQEQFLEGSGQLVPTVGNTGGVLVKTDGGSEFTDVLLSLLLKLPTSAVSELYLCLKHKDCDSLNTDDAVVFVNDDDGEPLWYLQFDYLRGVATPTT